MTRLSVTSFKKAISEIQGDSNSAKVGSFVKNKGTSKFNIVGEQCATKY
jgi:hypothetical protein